MAIGGIAVNIIAAFILHRVSNKLIMGVGAVSYTISFLLYSLNKTKYSYWPMIFPALLFAVIGADFEFNVTNVRISIVLPIHQDILT
jgi:nitrate/nitrite transporter NarK